MGLICAVIGGLLYAGTDDPENVWAKLGKGAAAGLVVGLILGAIMGVRSGYTF